MKNKYLNKFLCITMISAMVLAGPAGVRAADMAETVAADEGSSEGSEEVTEPEIPTDPEPTETPDPEPTETPQPTETPDPQPTATPALAISFAHFFVGLTCIISQRNIMKQIFGYCLMENGSHVTLALLAPTAPEIIEIGIATDAIFAVIIMSIVVRRIWDDSHSLDARDLSELRG